MYKTCNRREGGKPMSPGVVVVPRACVERLPIYYRALVEFAGKGIGVVSSDELAEAAGVKAFQLRKDLSYFGEFGIRGFGYDVSGLMQQMREILGISRAWKICIVGTGRLGTALVDYPGFIQHGLQITALFDNAPSKIGKRVGERQLEVQDISTLSETIKEKDIKIGVITVPAGSAQAVTDLLVSSGVKGIWNFAPVTLKVPDDVQVYQEDLSVGLLSLSHYLTRNRT
jgi:redox-sensing transcriptional repressor